MDKYYQECIFGGKIEIKNKDNIVNNKKLNKKKLLFKNKILELYDLYDTLYCMLNIDILEQKEIIIKKNIVAYTEYRQAEPIELIKINNFTNINDLSNIEKKIEIMKKVIKEYE